MNTQDWLEAKYPKGPAMAEASAPVKPITGTIERRLNRNPEEVIERARKQVAKFDAEYDQDDSIVIGFDLITDLIDVATELRKASPDA